MYCETAVRLCHGVQVRSEKFGLLFYSYQGPRLYFVPTKEFLRDDYFDGSQSARGMIDSICRRNEKLPRLWVEKQVGKILGLLKDKELISEQSVC
jgi:putative mycofactocin binding protein MftB